MRLSKTRRLMVAALLACATALGAQTAAADTTPQTLPFEQEWTNISQITLDDTWTDVHGIVAYRGDGLTSSTAVDPQTVLADGSGTPLDVIANQTNPAGLATGGIAEFELTDPVVAFQGSGTARAPHIVLTLSTTGVSTVRVEYDLRDVDGGADNAVQPVALQYRLGTSGPYTNVPAAFVADASTPNAANLITSVSVPLPAAAAGQPIVQVRWITTDAVGSDEWIGVDKVKVTGTTADAAPSVLATTPTNGTTDVGGGANVTVTFSEPVSAPASAFALTCSVVGSQAFTLTGGPTVFTLDPIVDLPAGSSCTVTVTASGVTDLDTDDPPNTMAANFNASFTTAPAGPVPGSVVVSEVYGGGGNAGATLTNDFIELYNRTGAPISLTGWSVQYASSAGTTWAVTPLTGSIPAGRNYLVQEAAGTGGTTPLPTPDATGSIAMSATSGKVALVASTTALTGGCPTGGAIVDFVGYGTAATCSETAPTGNLSNTTAALRKGGGTQDTNDNSNDFDIGAPDPHASADQAPKVTSTVPASGASGVARTANVSITFSEPVNTASNWFTIQCATSGAHAATASGGPLTFTLDPEVDFAVNESCTVTVSAAGVTDQDTEDPPDTMAADHVFSFQTEDVLVCGAPATRIHAVQGAGTASPLAGTPVTVEGVVVGDYQTPGVEFGGYYVQEEDGDVDTNALTSEGVFVFANGFGPDVQRGDIVRVRGTATEFSSLTEVASVNAVEICSTGASVASTAVSLPVAAIGDLERYEGMQVSFSQTLTATEVFNLGRFGEVSLSGVGRLSNPTAVVMPGPPAQAKLAENNRSRIILDDGNNQQNIDPTRYPQGGLSASNTLRVGDTLPGLTGVMDFRFSNYRIQPIGPLSFAHTNPRTPAPEPVGGNMKVASFNVLNFFNGDGMGGGFPTSRGAINQFELDRQKAKEVSALKAINGDVVGLMEIENDGGPSSALAELVFAVNGAMGAGTYASIDTGVIGTDEIKVALMYKPAAVTPVGTWRIITSAVDPDFDTSLNRPSLAQTFRHTASGETFTVVVNHLKSKGSACPAPDIDTGDGQGNCNQTRTRAANALVRWLATDPTGSGDPDYLLIGDMNSYTFEDPIRAFEAGGFTNLIRQFHGLDAYSYVFNGESGYLDHGLASASLAAQATGATDWHINPDEPTVLDYTTTFKTANQISTFYDSGPYRSSDHDPVVIGFALNVAPSVDAGGPYSVAEGGTTGLSATGSDPEGGALTYAWDLDDNGSFETPGPSPTFAAGTLDGPSTRTVRVRVTDPGGKTATDDATVSITNTPPSGTLEAPASAPAGFAFTLAVTGATDPSAADQAAGFTYAFDCGKGYGDFGPSATASCTVKQVVERSVGAKIRDKDGGVREVRATVDVFVTFDSLCELTWAYSSDAKVADQLCNHLVLAEEADDDGRPRAKRNHLDQYAKIVESKRGTGVFTNKEIKVLLRLVDEL